MTVTNDWENGFWDDDWDRCYECGGYGDDYYINDKGEFVSACPECPFNPINDNPWDE